MWQYCYQSLPTMLYQGISDRMDIITIEHAPIYTLHYVTLKRKFYALLLVGIK